MTSLLLLYGGIDRSELSILYHALLFYNYIWSCTTSLYSDDSYTYVCISLFIKINTTRNQIKRKDWSKDLCVGIPKNFKKCPLEIETGSTLTKVLWSCKTHGRWLAILSTPPRKWVYFTLKVKANTLSTPYFKFCCYSNEI